MSIAAKANKVCKSIKKPMSIPSKTRKDQKAHEHSSNPCEKSLKPMSITAKTQKAHPNPEDFFPSWAPALGNTALSHAHTASPRPLARTHDTNTKRNRNRFPDWGSPASINSPRSPIFKSINTGSRGNKSRNHENVRFWSLTHEKTTILLNQN